MNNNRLIGIALLVVGIALLYFGYNASQSVTETMAEAVTGRYTDETMVMLIGGGVVSVVGLFYLLRR